MFYSSSKTALALSSPSKPLHTLSNTYPACIIHVKSFDAEVVDVEMIPRRRPHSSEYMQGFARVIVEQESEPHRKLMEH